MLPARRARILAIGLLLAACGTPPPAQPSSSPPPPSSAPPVEASPPPASPAARTASAGPTEPPIAADPPALGIEAVGSGFLSPIGLAPAPGGWLLVNERDGRVVALDPESGETSMALDIGDRVLGGGEQGLLGLVLHPEWPDDGRAFVHYTDRNGDTVLSEFGAEAGDGPPSLDPASERVLLQVDQPYANHNGGQLAFGPDGHLYLGLGDGGAGGDPHGHGQDPGTLLGSVLRLDVSEAGGYAIPEGNPFADGAAGAPEVFLYGLRNPWRFSFDRATGLLWIADVGQNAYEEIDRLDPVADAGANLGWNVMEASHCFTDAACASDGLLGPVAEYGRDSGCSVTGGHVYRGEAIAGLRGWYLFSDYCSGLLFGIPSDARPVATPHVLLETGASVSTFGEAEDGELYLADLAAGTIYRVVGGG